jgi:hypothetical protein
MSSEGGRFADLMEQQSNTLAGQWSNFKDTLASIGETVGLEVVPAIKDMVTKIAKWVEENTETIQKAGVEIFNVIKQVADTSITVISGIYKAANEAARQIGKAANWLADQIAGTMSDADRVTAE